MSRFDNWLGVPDFRGRGLNWKGRVSERFSALRAKLVRARERLRGIARPDVSLPSMPRLDVAPMRTAGLNWKGRAIEGMYGLARAARRQGRGWFNAAGEWAFSTANSVCFQVYAVLVRSRRHRTTARSVLQLSIVSHKPYMLSRQLRAEGLKSEYFALNVGTTTGILDVGWDYAMGLNLSPRRRKLLECFYLWTVLARYDVIHSHFKSFLSHTGWELDYLKRLGTVLVFHSRGCDVRYRSLNMQLTPELNCCQECEYPVGSCDTDYQRQQVGIMTRHGDVFFVTTPDLRPFVPGSEHIPFIHPVGVNFEAIQPAPRDATVFRVVTSSNHHGIDGTRFIRAAVERLHGEGRAIELIEVNQMPYQQALSIYKSADVYVGKLRMGYYNNANIETMMLSVPNMSYIREDFRSIAPECPIILTRPDTVYERLNYYIDRRDELRAIGAKGPAFVRTHHDPGQLVRQMIARYNEAMAKQAGQAPPIHEAEHA